MVLNVKEIISVKTKSFTATVVLLSIISLIGCVAAIPLAVKYAKEKDKDMVKLTLRVDGNASDIFDASVRSQMKKSPETEIIKDDRENLIFEGKKIEASGVELWGRWKTKQISEGMTEVEFSLKAEGMKAEGLEIRAVSRILAFCREIGKVCKITK